jgi:hypothetical protein
MAKVIDEVFEESVTSSIDEPIVDEAVQVEPPAVDDDIPEKYRGKSPKEIIAMHQEAEKLIGKQGGEVGELRKVVDDFIKTQTSKDLKTQETETEEDDWYVNPKNSVRKEIENHPAIQEAKVASALMKKQETLARLGTEFPNFMDTVQSPSFAEWIKGSKVRTELYARAESNFDYDSAKELLESWTERQNITKKATETSKVDREQQLKAADLGSSSLSEPVSKKKYRRSDIIKLMQTDPERYNAMSDEILAAYSEGRVI